MLDLRATARALGGEIVGNRVLAPGPGHTPRDRSLSVWASPEWPGFSVHSFAGDDWRACRDYVATRLGLPQDRWRNAPPPPVSPCSFERGAPHPRADHEEQARRRQEQAMTIWEAAQPLPPKIKAGYEASRGVQIPEDAEDVRFHPACPFDHPGYRGTTPAMVWLVRNIRTEAPQGVHRTALDSGGHVVSVGNAKRLTLGTIKGGAIMITPAAHVCYGLGLAEGVETALSLRDFPEWQDSPVWSLISAVNLSHFPILPALDAIMIAVDADNAGERAANDLAKCYADAGREAYLIRPTDRTKGRDLNDLAREARYG